MIFASDDAGLFSAGFHPWYLNEFSNENFSKLYKWANDKRFLTIGECGLDKNSSYSLEMQIDIFKKQIELSEFVQKPLIIHCVGCFNELFEIKKTLQPQQLWIIHGFRGKSELAKQAILSGCSLSFGEHYNVESVSYTPINKFFIETDESSLPILEIYKQISNIKSVGVEDLNAGNLLIESINSKI